MEYVPITKYFILILIAIAIIYDIFIVLFIGPKPTISRVVLNWSISYPLIPFFVGLIIGHLFTYQEINK